MMESFVQRIPLSKELDVDFGRLFPTEVEGFIVIMTSKESEFKSKFQFLLIAPECVNTEELKELIGDVMVAFFDTGDKYTVKKWYYGTCSYPVKEGTLDDVINFLFEFWGSPESYNYGKAMANALS